MPAVGAQMRRSTALRVIVLSTSPTPLTATTTHTSHVDTPAHWACTSGLFTLNEDRIAERGARMARRDDRAYREYVREEQRSQPGCPARKPVLDQREQATSLTKESDAGSRSSRDRR